MSGNVGARCGRDWQGNKKRYDEKSCEAACGLIWVVMSTGTAVCPHSLTVVGA